MGLMNRLIVPAMKNAAFRGGGKAKNRVLTAISAGALAWAGTKWAGDAKHYEEEFDRKIEWLRRKLKK